MDDKWLREKLAKEAASKTVTIEDVIKTLKELSSDHKDRAVIVLNIGAPSDRAMHFNVSLAFCDYIRFMLRDAVAKDRMNFRTYVQTIAALDAAGITYTGISKFGLLNSDYIAKVNSEEQAYTKAVNRMKELSKELPAAKGAELDGLIKTIGLSSNAANIDIEKSDKKKMSDMIEGFQKFVSFGEGGHPIMTLYTKMSKEMFGVEEGFEQGYAVLRSLKRKKDESLHDFNERVGKSCTEIVCKLREDLYRFSGFARLSISPTSYGQIKPIGYCPEEEEDVVMVDAHGAAVKILSVSDKGEELMQKMKEKSREPKSSIL